MSNIAFPYPVLGHGDDYIDAEFQAAVRMCAEDADYFEVEFAFDLSDESILELIDKEQARYGFEIVCAKTALRCVEFTESAGRLKLKTSDYFQHIAFKPRIFVTEKIENFSSRNFNPEYSGQTFNLAPGDFLAAADDEPLNLDFEYLEFQDAIKIHRQESLHPYSYAFSLDGATIVIGMGVEFHDFWSLMINNNEIVPYLMMSVYKDCMVAALDYISSNEDVSRPWAQGLLTLLDEMNVKLPESPDFNNLNELAQKLLENDGVKKVLSK